MFNNTLITRLTFSIHRNFRGAYILWKTNLNHGLNFADHQVEYHCFLKPLLLFEEQNFALSKLAANRMSLEALVDDV